MRVSPTGGLRRATGRGSGKDLPRSGVSGLPITALRIELLPYAPQSRMKSLRIRRARRPEDPRPWPRRSRRTLRRHRRRTRSRRHGNPYAGPCRGHQSHRSGTSNACGPRQHAHVVLQPDRRGVCPKPDPGQTVPGRLPILPRKKRPEGIGAHPGSRPGSLQTFKKTTPRVISYCKCVSFLVECPPSDGNRTSGRPHVRLPVPWHHR